jgi:carbon storage regulator CsrA
MLVLKRRVNEQIVIRTKKDIIRITLVQANGRGGVRLGIDAPKSATVHRMEIDDPEQAEKEGRK